MLYVRENNFTIDFEPRTTYRCYNCDTRQLAYGSQRQFYCRKCKAELPDVYMIMTMPEHRQWWHHSPEVP